MPNGFDLERILLRAAEIYPKGSLDNIMELCRSHESIMRMTTWVFVLRCMVQDAGSRAEVAVRRALGCMQTQDFGFPYLKRSQMLRASLHPKSSAPVGDSSSEAMD